MDETRTSVSNRERAREQEKESRQRLERQEERLKQVALEISTLCWRLAAQPTPRTSGTGRVRTRTARSWNGSATNISAVWSVSAAPATNSTPSVNHWPTPTPAGSRRNPGGCQTGKPSVDAQCNALREERGGIDNELAQLTGEEESSVLRIRRNTLMEQLQEQAREWSRLTIAEALLEKTRHKFERERQPSVIRHAQDFFSTVTGQRYTGLYAPLGEQTISVTDAAGGNRQPSELSRGTREQLYLALRFGLIREFGEHAERLPVVVDEALVNFDPERARLAAESFGGLSETNQVLVFTCHPATAETFAKSAGAQVVDIGQEKGATT